jgi:flagellar biosynthesis protein FlhG
MVDSGRADPHGSSTGPPPNVRHVIAIGGGRGGVGKSVLATNLAVYLAQLGRAVILVDSDPAGAELTTLLGVEAPGRRPSADDDEPDDLEAVPTPIPGLSLLPQLYATGSTAPLRPGRRMRWARGLRQLNVDYVLLDLGAGTAPASLDLFLSADLGVCVTTPEPPSVEATYRFVRALFQRRLRGTLVKDRFRMRLVERALGELPPLPSPLEFIRCLARYDGKLAALAADELAQLRPRLVVNGVRLRGDTELGGAMHDMADRYLGLDIEHIGHVEQDDAVWLSVIRRRPLLIDSPASKSARNLERIARRIWRWSAAASRCAPPAGSPSCPRSPPTTSACGRTVARPTRRCGAPTSASERCTSRVASRSPRCSPRSSCAPSRRASRRPTTRCSIPCDGAPTTCPRSRKRTRSSRRET